MVQYSVWLNKHGSHILTAASADISGYLAERLQQGVSARSSARFLSSLKRFYGYALREGKVSSDPSSLIDAPKLGRTIPTILTEGDVDSLLQVPDINLAIGH